MKRRGNVASLVSGSSIFRGERCDGRLVGQRIASPIQAKPAEKLVDDPGRPDRRDSGLKPFDHRESGLESLEIGR